MSGLSLWLDGADASTIATTAGAVNSWTSKVNTNFVLTPSHAGNKPTFPNDGTGVRFTNPIHNAATPQTLRYASASSGVTMTDSYTLIACWRPFNTYTYNMPIEVTARTGSGPQIWASIQTGAEGGFDGVLNAAGNTWLRLVVPSPNNLLAKRTDVTVAGPSATKNFVNGTEVTGRVYNISPDYTLSGDHPINKVEVSVPNRAINGHVYEVLMYNRQLSTEERQQVGSYLSSKWGL